MALQQIAEGVFPDLGVVGIDARVISDSMTVAQARASVILWGNGERTLATAVGGPAHVVRGADLKQPIAIPRGRNIPCWCFPDPGNEESQREAGFLNLVVVVQLPNSCKNPARLSHLCFLYLKSTPKNTPRLALLPYLSTGSPIASGEVPSVFRLPGAPGYAALSFAC
ncbi:hypothetical protein AB9X41_17040 [Ralstonia solanacearum]|uniref:hypothetical protein n=1 Tax=Ralstonia solanacearum TaxID=305 RepID=UPI00351754C2